MFQPVPPEKCGTDIYEPILGRAAAYADIDADGDLDMLVTVNNDRIRLFRNEMTLPHNYLRVQLRGRDGNRDAIGAALLLEMDEGSQHRWVLPTRSYLSQVELPVTFGLGTERKPVKLTITWPAWLDDLVDRPKVVLQVTRTSTQVLDRPLVGRDSQVVIDG